MALHNRNWLWNKQMIGEKIEKVCLSSAKVVQDHHFLGKFSISILTLCTCMSLYTRIRYSRWLEFSLQRAMVSMRSKFFLTFSTATLAVYKTTWHLSHSHSWAALIFVPPASSSLPLHFANARQLQNFLELFLLLVFEKIVHNFTSGQSQLLVKGRRT